MSESRKAERKRGLKEAKTHIPALQQKWPACFPADPKRVRPLASSVIAAVMQEFGWTAPYARGVLHVWKSRSAYSNAILRYTERMTIDGVPSNETVDDHARKAAKERLEQDAAKRIRDAERNAKRLAPWRDTEGLPLIPPLSDDAISRETIYDVRG